MLQERHCSESLQGICSEGLHKKQTTLYDFSRSQYVFCAEQVGEGLSIEFGSRATALCDRNSIQMIILAAT